MQQLSASTNRIYCVVRILELNDAFDQVTERLPLAFESWVSDLAWLEYQVMDEGFRQIVCCENKPDVFGGGKVAIHGLLKDAATFCKRP